jgi:hypothetical protein
MEENSDGKDSPQRHPRHNESSSPVIVSSKQRIGNSSSSQSHPSISSSQPAEERNFDESRKKGAIRRSLAKGFNKAKNYFSPSKSKPSEMNRNATSQSILASPPTTWARAETGSSGSISPSLPAHFAAQQHTRHGKSAPSPGSPVPRRRSSQGIRLDSQPSLRNSSPSGFQRGLCLSQLGINSRGGFHDGLLGLSRASEP